ncbi:transcriptional regulator [Canicola haemoglobinophilus]|uniref:Transcriptional regulator n=1 Tax=Canicola haemoglobinophilus TaxID=733 RepID=A0A377HUJ4_9PAST|nr:transcriptional regulator [Canicola haemoglobinophilus]
MSQQTSILVIDDDIQICELLADIFDDHGYQVTVAQSGEQALKLLQNALFVDFS